VWYHLQFTNKTTNGQFFGLILGEIRVKVEEIKIKIRNEERQSLSKGILKELPENEQLGLVKAGFTYARNFKYKGETWNRHRTTGH